MEQKRKIIILCIILGVFAVTFLLGTIFNVEKKYKTIYEIQLLSQIEADEISLIELTTEDTELRLKKISDSWFVGIDGNEYPGDEDKIDQFIQKLLEIKTKRLVTENEEQLEKIGLDEDADRVLLYGKGEKLLEEIRISADSAAGTEYVKTTASNKVFAVDSQLSFYPRQEGSYWSDLAIFPDELRETEIVKIEIQLDDFYGDEKEKDPHAAGYTLVKMVSESGDQEWVIDGSEPESVKQSEVTSLINALTGVRADSYADAKETAGGQRKTIARVEAVTASDVQYELKVIRKIDDDSYLCSTVGNDYFYAVSRWQLERILKPVKKLLSL